MNAADVKKSIVEMTAEERLEIAALIAHLNQSDSPKYQEEMDLRMSAMDSGKKASERDFEHHHKDLLKKGR